jgi:hypothetical protein
MISLEVSIESDESMRAVRGILAGIGASGRAQMNDLGGREAVKFLRNYHRDYEGARRWTNPQLPTHGAGRHRSRFGELIVRAWAVTQANADGAVVTNAAPGFAHKLTGGVIQAKKKKALTIPMVPEAHARRVADYVRAFGRVFRPKGKSYLAQDDGAGGLRVIYLLRKRVNQKPWPGALPPLGEISNAYLEGIKNRLKELEP